MTFVRNLDPYYNMSMIRKSRKIDPKNKIVVKRFEVQFQVNLRV